MRIRRSQFRYFALSAGILALFSGVAAAAGGDDLDANISKGGVSIQPPKGWVPKAGNTSILAVVAPQADKEGSGDGYSASLSIITRGAPIDSAAQQKLLADTLENYRAVEGPAPVMIGGNKAVMFGGTFTVGKLQLRIRQYLVTLNNKPYVIAFVCLGSKWQAYQGVLDASVGTFGVK